jgi:hypothetical protein
MLHNFKNYQKQNTPMQYQFGTKAFKSDIYKKSFMEKNRMNDLLHILLLMKLEIDINLV